MGCVPSATGSRQTYDPNKATKPDKPAQPPTSPAQKPPAQIEDEVPAALIEGLKALQFLLVELEQKKFAVCVNPMAKGGGIEFGLHDVPKGEIHFLQLTDKQLAQHKDLKTSKWPAFFTALHQLFAQKSSKLIRAEGTNFAIMLPGDAQKRNIALLLEKRGKDVNLLHRLFVDPMIAFARKAKQQKTPEELKCCQKELEEARLRAEIKELTDNLKHLEENLVPLRRSLTEQQRQQQQAKDRLTEVNRKVVALKNPSDGPNLYTPNGPKRYLLHCLQAEPHDPKIIQPNKAAMLSIQLRYIEENPSIPREPVESSLAKMLKAAPESTHEAIMKTLGTVDDWGFDPFTLAEQTNGGALFITSYALIYKYGLVSHFGLKDETLVNFLLAVESGYHANPYHNAVHAADVLQCTHFILTRGGLKDHLRLKPEDSFAALLSAAIHDFDHPGLNNNFHCRTNAYLATLYNDRSVLENHHCACVFELMKEEKFNIFETLSWEQQKDIRDTILEMVLSTDMGNHAKIFQSFRRRLSDEPDWGKKDDQRLALSIAIKMADISNCARPTNLYMQWAKRIADEFYNQGDLEHKLSMTISPFMDRRKHDTDFPKGQVSFMNYIVVPLFEAGVELMPSMEFSVQSIQKNKEQLLERAG
eukprot:TRINITY_DN3589_c0_g1_i1.p1 TRINITY_DN3589_c0_g1~~TRINITY_DN3589_c0_g1_i1.p1  ORF type:complete len:644 (+),score=109.16 TRINITY_DN3589_c0_g1_i1:141-2072(+)